MSRPTDTTQQAGERTAGTPAGSASNGAAPTPPARLRLPLATADDVRRELARLYREGKSGTRDIGDVSRLANVLQILSRCIERSDFEARLCALEELQ